MFFFFFFSSRRRHTRLTCDWSSDVCSSDLFCHLQPKAPPPGLVIYLQASPATLIERVKRRGNTFEKNISEDYLRRLADGYNRFFHLYDDAPLMIINSENLNFADSQADFDLLLRQVDRMRGHREYFNRGI